MAAAMGSIFWAVWRRGWRSHRQATVEVEGGSSARPWTWVRMPAMVWVWVEMVGWSAEAGSRGLFVAAMAAGRGE